MYRTNLSSMKSVPISFLMSRIHTCFTTELWLARANGPKNVDDEVIIKSKTTEISGVALAGEPISSSSGAWEAEVASTDFYV